MYLCPTLRPNLRLSDIICYKQSVENFYFMKNIIAIRREDLSKKRETRSPIVPSLAARITAKGGRLLVQPALNPDNLEQKRAFKDESYSSIGAEITEDLSAANVILGVKEIENQYINPNTAYYIFSHTHKGQKKNRKMLQTFVEKKCTLIDYELITNEKNIRHITAFTYYAGYAGMVDALWALGQKLKAEGIVSRFQRVPQAIEKADLEVLKGILSEVKEEITQKGTTMKMPPMIFCFLGNGKTSMGAQEIFDSLPVINITPDQVTDIFIKGSRNFVYKLVLNIPDMFRLKAKTAAKVKEKYDKMNRREKSDFYLANPQHFESNMDKFFPYISVFMNCILWSPQYPRLFSREDTKKWYAKHKVLRVIGDISCDPEGGVEFSHDTWIDDPVFTYHPETETETNGFATSGISVLAVTNLPCEFPADASAAFSRNLSEFVSGITTADYQANSVLESGLPEAIKRATILWNGEFTEKFVYMKEFLPQTETAI